MPRGFQRCIVGEDHVIVGSVKLQSVDRNVWATVLRIRVHAISDAVTVRVPVEEIQLAIAIPIQGGGLVGIIDAVVVGIGIDVVVDAIAVRVQRAHRSEVDAVNEVARGS